MGTLRRHYEQAIRERAYAIWEEEGRPLHGNDLDHWLRAEAEIMPVHIDNLDHFSGQTVLDPFDGLDPATPIQIDRKTFVPIAPPGVGPRLLRNMAHYEGVLLSVHFIEDGRSRVEGSAVMVAPGIAFMATHVLESYIQAIMPSTSHMLCIGYTSSGLRIWRVGYYRKVEKSDVTILSLEYASPFPADGSFAQAMLTTRLPAIGEQVMIVGLSGIGSARSRRRIDVVPDQRRAHRIWGERPGCSWGCRRILPHWTRFNAPRTRYRSGVLYSGRP